LRGISRNFFRDAAKFRAKSEIPRKKQKKEKFEFYAYLKSHSQKNIFLNIFWFHLNRHFFQKSKKINIFLMENFLGLFARIFEKNRSSPRAKRRVFCPRRAKRSAKNFLYPLLPTASKNYFRIGIFSKSEKKLIFWNFLYLPPFLPTASKNFFRIGIFSKSEKKLIFFLMNSQKNAFFAFFGFIWIGIFSKSDKKLIFFLMNNQKNAFFDIFWLHLYRHFFQKWQKINIFSDE